jgi:structure-specific recognition protein 1
LRLVSNSRLTQAYFLVLLKNNGIRQPEEHQDNQVDDEDTDQGDEAAAIRAKASTANHKRRRAHAATSTNSHTIHPQQPPGPAVATRKAPQAPKRFKSSYICFFVAKQAEIKQQLEDDGASATVAMVSKRSAELWKQLSPSEKQVWEEVAAKDKQRYIDEKAAYTGPWQVPYKRAKKE